MSAVGKGKVRCQLQSCTGEEFTAVFNGVPGKGLTFVLQELRSKDYLGNKEGVLSKSPYHWRINPDENGNLCGEWILRFDEDVKSVIAYSHQTFVITLYDADKKELAKQRVASSNFGTGLKQTFPDGSKPGAYLQRTEMSAADDEVKLPEGKESSDYADGESAEVSDIVPDPEVASNAEVPETHDEQSVVSEEEHPEIQNHNDDFGNNEDQEDSVDQSIQEKPDEAKEVIADIRESSDDFKYSGIDEAITHSGGYVKESGISLKLVLLIFKIFIVFTILIVVYMVIKL